MDLCQEALFLFGHFPPQSLENQSSPITALAPRDRASNSTVCKKWDLDLEHRVLHLDLEHL